MRRVWQQFSRLNPSVYSAALRGGCCVPPYVADVGIVNCAVCQQFNKRTLLLLSCTDRYDAEFDVLRKPAVAAVVAAVYVVVIIVGALGSLLVFVSVISTRQMWTATNVFIANLALTDLIVCAFDLPLSLHYQVGNAPNYFI